MSPNKCAQVYSCNADMSLRSLPEYPIEKKDSFFIMRFMETLDRFDIAILNELQSDGRLSNAELATRVELGEDDLDSGQTRALHRVGQRGLQTRLRPHTRQHALRRSQCGAEYFHGICTIS